MIPVLMALALVGPGEDEMPEPYTLYHEAVACAVSASIEMEASEPEDGSAPTDEAVLAWPELTGEILTWGLVMAHTGPLAGRTPEQVDETDAVRAEAFFLEMRERKPEAFAAHRTYCKAFLH